MREVGAYEAKTHLPGLLEEVRKGETIAITRHGVVVAHLVPPPSGRKRSVPAIQAEMRELRREIGPIGIPLRELIEEGRRY